MPTNPKRKAAHTPEIDLSKATPGPWFDWETNEWIHDPKTLLTNYPDACLIANAPATAARLAEAEEIFKAILNEDEPLEGDGQLSDKEVVETIKYMARAFLKRLEAKNE